MKIAILNVTFQYGSTGQLAYNFYKKAKENGNEARLYYGRDCIESKDENIIKLGSNSSIYFHAVMSRLTGLEGYFSKGSTRKLIESLNEFSPDLIVLFNLVGYYLNEPMLFSYINEKMIKTVYSMIDEYAYCGKCCYPEKCQKFLEKCDKCPKKRRFPKSLFFDYSKKKQMMKKNLYGGKNNYIFTAPEYVCNRAKLSYILRNADIRPIDECIDVETYKPYATHDLRRKLCIPDNHKVVLNVCPTSNKRKGAQYYFDAIRLFTDEDITFIHIGCDTKKIDYPKKLIKVGYINDQATLSKYMALADVFVCTSTNDTMPNTCLEALASGTPIIGFDIAGIPFVADKKCGCFVETGNVRELAKAIMQQPRKNERMSEYCRQYALNRYSFDILYSKVMDIWRG